MLLPRHIVLHKLSVLQDLPRIHGKIVVRDNLLVIRRNWRPILKIVEFETLRHLLRRACGLLGNIRQGLPVAYEGHLGRGRRGSAATISPPAAWAAIASRNARLVWIVFL